MNRGLKLRASGLFLATLLLLSGGREAFGLGACPHHDALPTAGTTAARDEGHAAGHGMAGHPLALADHEADGHDAPQHSGACTCLGHCQPGTDALVAPSAGAVVPAPGAAARARSVTERRGALPGPTPYTLPFANAPPQGC